MNPNKDNNVLELEISVASLTVKCDACSKVLGERWPRGRDNMTVPLSMGENEQGYMESKEHHFCNEGCLLDHLNKRAAKAKKS